MGSIGDFAESLILGSVQNIQEGKELPPTNGSGKPSPGTPDIRNTRIPDSFMSQVLGKQYVSEQKEEVIEEETVEEVVEQPAMITESQASEMIDLLYEVRGLLKEMTTTGSLGMNLSGQSPASSDAAVKREEKKKGYKACSSSVLRDNLKKKLRSRRK
jgi:hypothetical protein